MKLPWILCLTALLTVSAPTYAAAKSDCALMQQLSRASVHDLKSVVETVSHFRNAFAVAVEYPARPEQFAFYVRYGHTSTYM